MKNENKIKSLLIKLGISTEDSIVPFFSKVRDRNDLKVLKCKKSDVLLLSGSDHVGMQYYKEKKSFRYSGAQSRRSVLAEGIEDAQRRCEQFKYVVANKKWIDVGTGAGGILDLFSAVAQEIAAVEPQEIARKNLVDLGYKVYSSIGEAPNNYFDVTTLFHSLEHFTDPIGTLKAIKGKMSKGGKIIVEVPHARDFLISFLENDAFKSFTFWSEHLILHTRESLKIFLEAAGFSRIVISGFQRYPLANHFFWLVHGKPGGHIAWQQLRTKELDQAYSHMLASIDKTDTLIATAENI